MTTIQAGQPETLIFRTDRGWTARTEYPLEGVPGIPDGALLVFYTSKDFQRFLVTSAKVVTVEGGFETHRVYQDFFKRVAESRVQMIEKHVTAQHLKAIESVGDITQQVRQHYQKIYDSAFPVGA